MRGLAKQLISFTQLIFLNLIIQEHEYIEGIYFFEVNTKYISSSVLKTSEFS